MALTYAFNPALGETPKSIAEKRRLSEALAARIFGRAPQNVGEGLNAIGQALIARSMLDEANAADRAGTAGANDAFSKITGLITGGSPIAVPPAAPKPAPAPATPSIPAAAVSSNSLTDTPAPLSGGLLAPTAAAATPGTSVLPRGLRNNNPLNIEAGTFTQSQPGFTGSDGRFAQFGSLDQGLHAADTLLQSYANKGINTVAGIVNRWAPPSDGNPTNAYAASVAKAVGVDPNAPLDMSNPALRQKIIGAMAQFENGRPLPTQVASLDPSVGIPAAPSPQASPATALAFNGKPIDANPLADVSTFAPSAQAAAPPPSTGFAPPAGPSPSITTAQVRPATLPFDNAPNPVPSAPTTSAAAPQTGPSTAVLMQAMSNPFLTDGQRAVVATILKQRLTEQQQANDPLRQLQIAKARKDLTKPDAPTAKFGVISHDAMGNPIYGFSDATNHTVTPVSTPTSSNSAAADNMANLTGEAFLKAVAANPQLGPGKAQLVKSIAEGRTPYPSGYLLKTPFGQWLVSAVGQYEPGIDATLIGQRRTFNQQLGSGSFGSIGGQKTLIGTTLGHLADLAEHAVALHNYSGAGIPGIGALLAETGNFLSSGSTKQNALINGFDQNVDRFTGEAAKLYSGSAGGGVAERQAVRGRYDYKETPEALAAALETDKELILSKLQALQNQHDQIFTGPNAPKVDFLGDSGRAALKKIDESIAKLRGQKAPSSGTNKTKSGVTWSVQ